MTNKELTEIEKRFAEYWSNLCNDVGFSPASKPDFLREKIKEIAYHEAGHFAARMFTCLELSHIQIVSIMPGKVFMGRMVCERGFAEHYIDKMPQIIQRSNGISLLLEIFAGDWSVNILNKLEEESFYDYYIDEIEEDYDKKGTDLNRALRIAKILSRPYMSEHRILSQTYKWTGEMLMIPAVWNAVETVAEILISKGEITKENDEISGLVNTLNIINIYRIPKWNRRIFGK